MVWFGHELNLNLNFGFGSVSNRVRIGSELNFGSTSATSLPTCVCAGKVVVVPTRLCMRKEETEEEVVVVVPHHT